MFPYPVGRGAGRKEERTPCGVPRPEAPAENQRSGGPGKCAHPRPLRWTRGGMNGKGGLPPAGGSSTSRFSRCLHPVERYLVCLHPASRWVKVPGFKLLRRLNKQMLA